MQISMLIIWYTPYVMHVKDYVHQIAFLCHTLDSARKMQWWQPKKRGQANLWRKCIKDKINSNVFFFQIHKNIVIFFSISFLFSTTNYADHEDQMLKLSDKSIMFLMFWKLMNSTVCRRIITSKIKFASFDFPS